MAPASLAATNQKANSDLLEAAEAGDELKVVAALAQPGVDVNCCDERCYRRTPLLRACLGGDYKEVAVRRLLEDSRVNVNACDQRGQTALHLCYLQEELLEEILLFKRTDIDWNAADMIGQTPILWFARLDDEESVRRLIGVESVNLFATTIDLFTALHQVAESKTPLPNWAWPRDISNRCKIVDLVLEAVGRSGHNVVSFVDATDILNRSALHYIAEEGCIEILKLFWKYFANMNLNGVDFHGFTPLHLAVRNGHDAVVERLLRLQSIDTNVRATVNASNPDKLKPFEGPDHEMYRPNLFLKRPEEQPSRDLTPLHFAAMDGRMEVVRLLLKWEGINIDAVDSAGLTPLKYSVQNGHTEVMKLLLKKGIESATLDYATLDYNREYGFFEDLLRLATKRGHVETVQELLEHPKLDVNAQDNRKMTPLLYAIEARNVDMVKVLCQKDKFDRLRATEENSARHTPLQIVVENKKTNEDPHLKAIEKVLLERPEVKDFVERLYRDRQVFVDAANALLVGAALIASVTFAGWLQPPLGYIPYYDFSQPFPAPPGAYESYAAIKQNPKVKAFWVFNSLSFFFAIATVLAGADAAMPSLDDAFIGRVVNSVRRSLIVASILLVMSVVCVLGAFASAGFAVLPPLLKYDTSMIITVCVGGTVCMIILAKFLWKLANAIRIRVLRRMKPNVLVGVDHQLV